MMQYGNVDVTLDIIRGIGTIRRGAHALLWGVHKSGCIHVLMLKIEMDILRLSHICDTLPQVPLQSHAQMLYLSTKYMNMNINVNTNTKTVLTTIMRYGSGHATVKIFNLA